MKMLATLMAAFVLVPWRAHACSFPPPPDFDQAVRTSDKIFVLRLLDEKLSDRATDGRPVIESRVEIVETISGEPPKFQTLEFFNTPCGGVRLDVGHHYVVFTSQSGSVLRLVPADNSIVSVEGEYIPGFSRQNNLYPFLKSVRAFANKEIPSGSIDPFPNIERNGTVRRLDCDPCRLQRQ